jgi:hypothetical protein
MNVIVHIFMRDVYYDLHPTAEQQEDENWWKNVFLQKAVNSDEYNFQKTWEELRDTSPYEVFLIIEMINQINEWSKNELGHTWDFGVLTHSKIYKMYAYVHVMQKGVEHWKFQSSFWNHDMDNMSDTESVEEEYTGTKDFPPNETDDNCPICLDAYTPQKQKDGVRNSEYKVKCPHYCCCDCWLELYEKNEGEKKRCPICRANVTDWLESVIPSYYPDYP